MLRSAGEANKKKKKEFSNRNYRTYVYNESQYLLDHRVQLATSKGHNQESLELLQAKKITELLAILQEIASSLTAECMEIVVLDI